MDRLVPDAPDAVGPGSIRPAEPTTAAQRDRRRRIVHAAMDLLSEHGYDEIQMRDVAVGAGVALGTLYRYFPSKEQLFAHVLLEWSASFDEAMRRRRPERGTDAERLRLLLRRAVGAFERHPSYFQLLSVLEVSKDPAVVEPFAAYSQRFFAAVGEALTDTAPEDVPVVTMLTTSLLSTLLRGWWLGHHSIRVVNARIDQAVDVLFEGARPR
ncbi:TetR family transcriptional regulator [Dermatobacter hominis]|uniref:TetR family transcriptional regulator n=1 Tax=Dermatobacter hominis TaxID=2884263 RepID=UPI001D1122FF|nr:TetR family transcriptional regulator [Dermatobacter hominis]UDY36594.1 TetR family transcriptional regulator [Dermatobacter hominis]